MAEQQAELRRQAFLAKNKAQEAEGVVPNASFPDCQRYTEKHTNSAMKNQQLCKALQGAAGMYRDHMTKEDDCPMCSRPWQGEHERQAALAHWEQSTQVRGRVVGVG